MSPRKDKWTERKQERVERKADRDVAKAKVEVMQAFCTECKEYYNMVDAAQANRHTH